MKQKLFDEYGNYTDLGNQASNQIIDSILYIVKQYEDVDIRHLMYIMQNAAFDATLEMHMERRMINFESKTK